MDYFNEEERAKQMAFAAKRDRFLSPVISILVSFGATANLISIIGVVFLLWACLLPHQFAFPATFFMLLHVCCDGIDGPLARHLGTAHAGGSLIDIVVDQLGVIFLPAAAIYHFDAWGPAMVIFASSYLIFIALAVYANELGVELRKFIRSKYLLFLLYLGSLHWNKDLVTYFCAAFAVYYSIEIFEALRRIYLFHEEESLDSNR